MKVTVERRKNRQKQTVVVKRGSKNNNRDNTMKGCNKIDFWMTWGNRIYLRDDDGDAEAIRTY